MHRALTAHTPLGDIWWALGLAGKEALSDLYEFHLALKSKVSNIDVQSLIGEVAAVELEAQNRIKRYFSGQIVEAVAKSQIGKYWHYEVTIAPKLWHASRRSDFRIWQNVTVQDIATEVLAKNAIRYEWRLKNQYKTWEYLVQYGETDLSFLLRRFDNEGIYFWFEHGIDGETLILADHFSTHEPFCGYEKIPFYPPDRARPDVDQFFAWSAGRVPEPGHFQHSDYDFKHPSKDLTTTDDDPRGHLFDQYQMFAYPGNYVDTNDGSAYAAVRLDELQLRQDTIELEGRVRGVIPGYRFQLTNHPREEQNRELVVTRAEHVITNDDYEGGTDSVEAHYQVKIGAIPADRQFRVQREPPKKPLTHGPETAVVVGPPGSEIHTDEYGRIKVHFHWDRYGAKDGSDSTWIRVSYPWAGNSFGGIHIPRVGQEVIVDYEFGDPDRPIVVGRVFNAENMPPWDLPANKTQSGVLSRSTLGATPANANAFRFEDARGQEQVWLHAERDFDVGVERNMTETVGLAYLQNVGAGRIENVGAAYDLNVGLGYLANVGGLYNLNVAGAFLNNVGGLYDLNVVGALATTVGGALATTVAGALTTTVGAASAMTVAGASAMTVGGPFDLNVAGAYAEAIAGAYVQTIGGAYAQAVGGAHATVIGGAKDTNIGAAEVKTIGEGQITIVGDTYLVKIGGNSMILGCNAMLALKVGCSMVALTSKGIILKSGAILLNGIAWDDHKHPGVKSGCACTGPPC